MVLAQEPAVRMCSGESSRSTSLWSRDGGGSREAQEAADIGRAVKHAFEVIDGEILDRSRAEAGRDGATALVLLRIGQAAGSIPSSLLLIQLHEPVVLDFHISNRNSA